MTEPIQLPFQEWRDGTPVCMCGCGEKAGFYAASCNGHRKGDPKRFATGHSFTSPKATLDNRVDRCGPDECWPWTGARTYEGYGRMGPVKTAHRAAYVEAYGPVPPGMHVLHTCDNPPCCNPAHLRLGTHQDNMADRDAKGRNNTAGTKLNLAIVREIRARYAAGDITQAELAAEYGLHRIHLGRLLNNRHWPEEEAAA